MNKKFTYLVAALLATGAWNHASATLTEVASTSLTTGADYLVGVDADLADDAFDLLLKSSNGQGAQNETISNDDEAWTLEQVDGTNWKLKKGTNYLCFVKNEASVNLSVTAASGNNVAAKFTIENGKLKLANADEATATNTSVYNQTLYLKFTNGSAATLASDGTENIIFATYKFIKPTETASKVLSTSAYYVIEVGEKVLGYNTESEKFEIQKYDSESEAQLWTLQIGEQGDVKLYNKVGGVWKDNATGYMTFTATKDGSNWTVADPESVSLTGTSGITGMTSTIALGTATPYSITADNLNTANRGSFILNYQFDKDHVATDNAFAKKELRAFEYSGKLYLATAWPEEFNDYKKYQITGAEDFNSFTFLVAEPNDHYNLTGYQNFGESAKFVEVKGSRLVSSAQVDDLKAGKYAIENAQFTVTEKAGMDGYTLSLAAVKGLDKDKANIETSGKVTVILVDDQKGRIVTTAENYTNEAGKISDVATIANKRTVAAADFLSTDKASVFNIKFVSKTIKDDKTESEYNKYLTVKAGLSNGETLAHGSDFANLNAPENQWIVAGVAGNEFIFQNRELEDVKFQAELVSTSEKNVYELRSDDELDNYAYVNDKGEYTVKDLTSQSLGGMKVELTAVTPNAQAGYAVSELDNAGLVRFVFNSDADVISSDLYVTAEQKLTTNANEGVGVSKEEGKAAQFSVVKFDAASTSTALSDTIYATNDYVVWDAANKTTKTVADGDTIAVVSYAFQQLRADGKPYFLSDNMKNVEHHEEAEDADRFIVKINKNGSYALIPASSDYFRSNVDYDTKTFTISTSTGDIEQDASIYYDYTTDRKFDFNILKETPGTSFNHVPQHVTMEAVNGGFVAMSKEADGIVAMTETEAEGDLVFWLDTIDSEAVTPAFYISHAGNYMYNATDSLNHYNDGTASAEEVKEFGIDINGQTFAKAIFQAADLEKVGDEDIKNYKFQIVESADNADEYVIKSLNGYEYVAAHNQKLYFTSTADDALRVVVTRVAAPTANEGVAATEVAVIANDGSIVVKNAAGKNVVVSTILGQVVANEVLSSDNATINVPAGIVVVSVEGESFKVNVR